MTRSVLVMGGSYFIDRRLLLIIPRGGLARLQFIYSGDLANIISALIDAPLDMVSVFNVGNRKAVTIREWIKSCAESVGQDVSIIEYDFEKDGRRIRDFFRSMIMIMCSMYRKLTSTARGRLISQKVSECHISGSARTRTKSFLRKLSLKTKGIFWKVYQDPGSGKIIMIGACRNDASKSNALGQGHTHPNPYRFSCRRQRIPVNRRRTGNPCSAGSLF